MWDTIQCMRTVQFATRKLATDQIQRMKSDHPFSNSQMAEEEVDREFLAAVIGMVHSPGWADDD
jgi:hypothetical protein